MQLAWPFPSLGVELPNSIHRDVLPCMEELSWERLLGCVYQSRVSQTLQGQRRMRDCPTVPLPDDQHLWNPNLQIKKHIFPPSRMVRSSRDSSWGGGKRKKGRGRSSLQSNRDSLLMRERWEELGWNLKAVPWWCRDFVQTSYPGMADFGMSVLRQMKINFPTFGMYSYLYHYPS